MSFQNYWQKIKFIDHLIASKATGGQKTLARKLDISVSTLNEYLNAMRDAGFPIKYCRKRQSYYYEKEGRMVDSLFDDSLGKEDMKRVTGGKMHFFRSDYSGVTAINFTNN